MVARCVLVRWWGTNLAAALRRRGDTGRRLLLWGCMVGDEVAEERQLHSQSRIVGMNTRVRLTLPPGVGQTSTNTVAEQWRLGRGQLAEQARTAESPT